jgi:hypothetical protein
VNVDQPVYQIGLARASEAAFGRDPELRNVLARQRDAR